ncbi:MAG: hypothetical protein APF76_01280 [Desulfitibacter sp. BRH_c19]|nr:MAG: hypothetical protein APF76_01280 [Desulfitibacter sp. BRH_c19]
MFFWEGQEILSLLQWILRAGVISLWLLLIVKVMGQRLIGRLNLFDFIIAITIGSVAAGPLSDSQSGLIGPILTMTFLGVFHVLTAYLALKNSKIRRVVQDEPIVLIQNGRLIREKMYKARFNLDDVLFALREKNMHNLHDVEFAILESNGQLSVIPKSQIRPLQPRDLGIPTSYEGMATVLIEDGNIIQDNLKRKNLDENWLIAELEKQDIHNPNDVMVAMLDTLGRLYVSKKNEEYIDSSSL